MRLGILPRDPYPDPGNTGVPEPHFNGNEIDSPHFAALPAFKSRRTASLGGSLAGHAAVISAVMFWFGPQKEPVKPLIQQYSVRILQLKVPPAPPPVVAGGSNGGSEPGP